VAGVLGVLLCASGPSVAALDPTASSIAVPAATAEPSPAPREALLLDAGADPVARRPGVGVVPRVTAVPDTPTPTPTPAAAGADGTPSGAAATGPARGAVVPAAAPAAAVPAALPLGVHPPGTQLVTVVASSASATTAELIAWELGDGGWTAVLGPVAARVGSAGVGRASETSTRTPAGTFGLTEAFGRAGDPGTALPYQVVDGDDWWVSDPASPLYNSSARCGPGTCPFDESVGENLYAAGAVYDHAVVIDYNRAGTAGAGSAFFLHVTNGAPTAGCVAIGRGSLQTLLRWLDPSASPVIAIGVG
jgi:L,D-peptidoglycan transpeptidase YkuD (ErfK/YbiS/YcfS/YnhG family)